MKIIGTGLTGLVGARVTELLTPQFTFTNLSLETGFDITNHEQVRHEIEKAKECEWFFHFAAMTDVEGAQKDCVNGKKGKTWTVNVDATENISAICHEDRKHVLYISTDYVFDGKKDFYTEDDPPDPQGWYGVTKYEGEKHVLSLGELGLIIRIANPYRSLWSGKPDFVHKIRDRFEKKLEVVAPNDQLFVPTFIDDIAAAICYLVEHKAYGIYNVVGTGAITPFQGAQMIADSYGYDNKTIKETTFEDFFRERASRPFRAYLKNDKITQCGITMATFEEGLQRIVKQEKGL